MEPGPRVRAVYVDSTRSSSLLSSAAAAAGEEEAGPTITILLYLRPHHACSPGALPKRHAELDACLHLMAQAGRLQHALGSGSGEEAGPLQSVPTPTAHGPWTAAASNPPSFFPSFMVQSSLACVQLRARCAMARRALSPSSGPSAGAITGLLLDSLLGAALGVILWRHEASLGPAVAGWYRWLLCPEALAQGGAWLASDPGGFKLNLPLTQRLGAVVVLVAELYTAALHHVAEAMLRLRPLVPWSQVQVPWALVATGGGGLVGATTLLAGGFDLLRVLTGHVPLIHASVARLYRLELCTLASLGRLFRGHKLNVLRRRVDSCKYSTEQLLLGTLLFTIGVALFPTLAAFHALATTLHLSVRALQAALWLLLVLLRDLPLHALALRLCRPDRFLDPLHVAGCRPLALDGGDATTIGTVIYVTRRVKEGKAGQDGVTGAGATIVDTEGEEGEEEAEGGAEPAKAHMQAAQALLRLEYGQVPWARLFDDYARTARALREAGPSPGRALGALLGGELLVDGDSDAEGPVPESPMPFLQYHSLPQILVEAALASAP